MTRSAEEHSPVPRAAANRRRLAFRSFLVAALLAVGAGALAVYRLEEARHASVGVQHTQEVMDALQDLRAAVTAIDAAQHALIRVVPQYSDSSHKDRTVVALARARAVMSADSAQQERLDTLEHLVEAKLAELTATIGLIEQGTVDSARAVVRDEESERRNERIDSLLVRMNADEHRNMFARTTLQIFHATSSRTYVVLVLAASLALATLGAVLLRREEHRARTFAAAAESAASAARRSEARFRAAINAMLDAFYIAQPVLDADGSAIDFEMVEANDAGATFAGVSREQLLGARLSDLLPLDRAAAVTTICQGVVQSGTRHSGEYHVITSSVATAPRDGWIRLQVVRTAEGVAITCHDITLSKRLEVALAVQAGRDELTGLLNRRGFRALAEHQIRLARRESRSDAILTLDLSGFKQINDTFGHAEGDEGLRAVARLLEGTVRESDVIGRFGGDEFVIYAPGVRSRHEGECIVTHLAEAFRAANLAADAAGRTYQLTAGIGLAVLEKEDTLDTLLARADSALYAEKRRQSAALAT